MSLTEDELLEVKLEEMKCEITHLETEQEKLTAQLRTKEMQLDKTQRALEQVTQQLQVSPPHVVLTSSDKNLQPFFFPDKAGKFPPFCKMQVSLTDLK